MGKNFKSFCDVARGAPSRLQGMLQGISAPRTQEMTERLTASYQPMLAVLLLPAAVYFALMTGLYFVTEELPDFLLLGGISSSTAAACIVIRKGMEGKTLTFHGLESRGIILFALVYTGLVAEQIHRLQPHKIPLFMFLMLVTATASVSIRIATGAVAICTATAFVLAGEGDSGRQMEVLLLALGSSLVAFSMTAMTRLTIMKEICARMTAEDMRKSAQLLADHDSLTGLANRRVFLERLEDRFKRRRGSVTDFAIAIVDLDNFKAMNDTFGYSVGDGILAETGKRLKEVCGDGQMLARLSSDKFAILIDGPLDTEKLTEFGMRIRNKIDKPYDVMGIRVRVSASVGIVPEQINIFTCSEMFERADFAMACGRTQKRGITVFSQELEDRRRQISAVEHNLRHSDLEEEMYVVFQPLVDIQSGQPTGFEALARWENRELGPIPPDVFIAAAERTGMIRQLTPALLRKALEAARDWPEGLKLSFNLSIRDISSPTVIEQICDIVGQCGFPAQQISFEVTETLIMQDFEQARASLARLQALGASVALDDFGVGYANFGHIDQLNINTIKIDRSFVTRLTDHGNSGKILKTMIDMCANLGVGCVVEGVETVDELAVLKRLGARCVQGYYFSKPMGAGEIPAYFARALAASVAEPEAQSEKAG